MFRVDDDSKKAMPSKEWRRKVAKFVNNLCGDGLIEIDRPDHPSAVNPPALKINIDRLVNALKNAGIGAKFPKVDYATKDEGGNDLTPDKIVENAEKCAEDNAPEGVEYFDDTIDKSLTGGNLLARKKQVADALLAMCGTSKNSARADHTHPLKLCELTDLTGMSAAQKEKFRTTIDGDTYNEDSNDAELWVPGKDLVFDLPLGFVDESGSYLVVFARFYIGKDGGLRRVATTERFCKLAEAEI